MKPFTVSIRRARVGLQGREKFYEYLAVTARIPILFVCARNQWRSPTAERMYRDDNRFSVRSCGLSAQSPRRIREEDLAWAEVIFVMESKHRKRLVEQFHHVLEAKQVHVLDIPDDYQFMDPELIEIIQDRVEGYFRHLPKTAPDEA